MTKTYDELEGHSLNHPNRELKLSKSGMVVHSYDLIRQQKDLYRRAQERQRAVELERGTARFALR
jgi:hypothetical protein